MFVCMVDKPEPMQRGPWNKNVGNAMSSIQLIFTDRISTGGNAIASVLSSVHPSVSTLTFEPSDLWPWTFCMCMGHDHRSHGIECQGYIFRVSVFGWWDLHWRPFSSFFIKDGIGTHWQYCICMHCYADCIMDIFHSRIFYCRIIQ